MYYSSRLACSSYSPYSSSWTGWPGWITWTYSACSGRVTWTSCLTGAYWPYWPYRTWLLLGLLPLLHAGLNWAYWGVLPRWAAWAYQLVALAPGPCAHTQHHWDWLIGCALIGWAGGLTSAHAAHSALLLPDSRAHTRTEWGGLWVHGAPEPLARGPP